MVETKFPEVSFIYSQKQVRFLGPSKDDHLLVDMQRTGTFYERDVLELIRDHLPRKLTKNTAIDVGAFIGTHTVYFAQFCGLSSVIAFEPFPESFLLLQANIDANALVGVAVAFNLAIGEHEGAVEFECGREGMRGETRVIESSALSAIKMYSLDAVLSTKGITGVNLIKIDVEGEEISVLKGAEKTIKKDFPLLCVEIHTSKNLTWVIDYLSPHGYRIIDCRGYSPTYLIKMYPKGFLSWLVNRIWIVRASIKKYRFAATLLLLLARSLSTLDKNS